MESRLETSSTAISTEVDQDQDRDQEKTPDGTLEFLLKAEKPDQLNTLDQLRKHIGIGEKTRHKGFNNLGSHAGLFDRRTRVGRYLSSIQLRGTFKVNTNEPKSMTVQEKKTMSESERKNIFSFLSRFVPNSLETDEKRWLMEAWLLNESQLEEFGHKLMLLESVGVSFEQPTKGYDRIQNNARTMWNKAKDLAFQVIQSDTEEEHKENAKNLWESYYSLISSFEELKIGSSLSDGLQKQIKDIIQSNHHIYAQLFALEGMDVLVEKPDHKSNWLTESFLRSDSESGSESDEEDTTETPISRVISIPVGKLLATFFYENFGLRSDADGVKIAWDFTEEEIFEKLLLETEQYSLWLNGPSIVRFLPFKSERRKGTPNPALLFTFSENGLMTREYKEEVENLPELLKKEIGEEEKHKVDIVFYTVWYCKRFEETVKNLRLEANPMDLIYIYSMTEKIIE